MSRPSTSFPPDDLRRGCPEAGRDRTTAMTIPGANTLSALSGTIVLVGAGKMGGAMLEGWLGLGLAPENVVVIEPQPAAEIVALAARGLRINPKPGGGGAASAIVIAVKPQVAADVLPTLNAYVGTTSVVVSIMAGRTLGFLEQSLPPRAALIRAMPNTPASIGRGIT